MFATSVFAQHERWDISADYTYFHFNPTVTGLQSRSFNGGGGAIQVNWGILGFKADLQGFGSTTVTYTNTGPVVTPHGTIPAGSFSSQANQFTWLFGPVLRIPMGRVVVFGETLFGGSNTNLYSNLEKSIDAGGGSIINSGTQHPFTMAVGGGLDVHVSKVVALRLGEFDYMLTRYTNPLTNTNNQNNFRYVGGVVFTFGGSQ
jgi:hypothetical protein